MSRKLNIKRVQSKNQDKVQQKLCQSNLSSPIIYFIFLMLLPILSWAQINSDYQGINWTKDLNWEQIKAKARNENKFIFLDCYATWCLPCKQMDVSVYSLENVGKIYNNKFISVKVQMDKSRYDDTLIRRWYKSAVEIQTNYQVTVLPTYLFFSSDGKPVHKISGSMSAESFIALANDVFNPQKQYYRLLEDFQPGKIDTSEIKGLARAMKASDKKLAGRLAIDYLSRISESEIGSTDNLKLMLEFQQDPIVMDFAVSYFKKLNKRELATKKNLHFLMQLKKQPLIQNIACDYLKGLKNKELGHAVNLELMKSFKEQKEVHYIASMYIKDLKSSQLWRKDNIEFVGQLTSSSKDVGFKLFYNNSDEIDLIVGRKYFAQGIIDYIISKEEIDSLLNASAAKRKEPDWEEIGATIAAKYDANYAKRNLIDAKVRFYGYQAKKFNKEWQNYIKYVIVQLQEYGTDTTNSFYDLALNNTLWNVFIHSNDMQVIKVASKWMAGVVERDHGKTASYLDTYANLLYKGGNKEDAIIIQEKAVQISQGDKVLMTTLDKMKNGYPTW